MKTELQRWLVRDRLIGQRIVSALARVIHDRGNRNPGWYGDQEIPTITGSWRQMRWTPVRHVAAGLSRQIDFYADQIFTTQVWEPIAGSVGSELTPLQNADDPDFRLGDKHLERQRPKAEPSASPPSFSIVTPYYRHFTYFKECARSVAEAIRQAEPLETEWVVVNDDPSIACDKLWSVVPRAIHDRTRIIANDTNIGNTATLNAGIAASRHEWIAFLDCDDVIFGRALKVMSRYIAAYPLCRYFSSSMVDIDEEGRVVRYRIRDTKATQLFTGGMTAGHLKAIRRDTFDNIGLLDARFDGCQDYEFALRTAMAEPMCFVPEFLYGYRSHTHTQTLSGLSRQLSRAREIRRVYVGRVKGDPASDSKAKTPVQSNLDIAS